MNLIPSFRNINLRFGIIALLFSILIALACEFFYKTSPVTAINIENFQSQLSDKESKASKVIDDLQQIIIHSSNDSLIHFPFANDDISYFVFEKGNLIFWSNNNLDINSIEIANSFEWRYVLLPNAHCVSKLVEFNSTKILAVILIKNNYPYQNKELQNNFAPDFETDKQVQLVLEHKTDKYAVFGSKNQYLFSLSDNQQPIYNENWSLVGLIGYGLAFLIFFILYANSPYLLGKKSLSLVLYFKITVVLGILVALCLYFNFPDLLFWNRYFSPFQYASNPFLSSICHLSVATGYVFSSILLFYFHVKIDNSNSAKVRVVLMMIFALYFVFIYYLLSGLIYHSSIQFTILQFYDFSFLKIWIYFIILLWGIGLSLLFVKTHRWLKFNYNFLQLLAIQTLLSVALFLICWFCFSEEALRLTVSYVLVWLTFSISYRANDAKRIYLLIALWSFIYTTFIISNSLIISTIKKNEKYRVLAQNIYSNGNVENDQMADILLEELNVMLLNDKKIGRLVANVDSLALANDYLNKTYLRGFWNRYDMRLNAAPIGSETYNIYQKFIASMGTKVKDTHFFSVPVNENNMSYVGEFQSITNENDTIAYYMEFYPRRNFKSYSFPNLLIPSTSDIQTHLDIAIAKYEHQKLVFSSGDIEFNASNNWIPKKDANFFRFVYNYKVYYVYAPQTNSQIVIAELQLHKPSAYVFYFIYTFLAYFSFCSLLTWFYLLVRRKHIFRLGLTAKFQFSFIILLIISFLLIFYVSVNFIQMKYQQEQIVNLENKKKYIQKALQDMYYWNQELSFQNMQALNFDLQELSYTYHTDIHVYDNRGMLVGSSQPVIFSKNLLSNRIAALPYFTQKPNLNQYEHIGMLNYLTGYTDFLNGDYLQIGYISVPQFFSQDEIRNEIESFLSVIIHIYLIVILLVILVSLFIGRQLSAPLNMLENKLKEMRLGRRNEKIDYKLNDEIGQLVVQYNRTIDELEQSAKLLAKSERESAWKTMARQVAHEINNPLTPMKLTIQQLLRTKNMNDERFDDYFQKSAVMLIEQIDNLSRIAGTFSDFARMPEAKFVLTDVALKLNSVLHLFANNHEQVQMKYEGDEKNVFLFADPEQLVQVFNNLLKNAIQAIPDDRSGEVSVLLQTTDKDVIIRISDNGIGINDEQKSKLFTPNFTTKTTGMGLGLAISKNIVELSGGTISYQSKSNEGTVFTIKLPKASS